MPAERMTDFFESRIDTYDAHMLTEIEGLPACYARLAEELPEDAVRIADLGAGTGLALIPILERLPHLCVNAIDLSGPMLSRLVARFEGKHICPIVGDFRTVKLGIPFLNAVISVESMHHISEEDRRALYPRIHGAIRAGGVYLEGDYVAADTAEEERLLTEAEAARAESGYGADVPLHLDIPMTAEHIVSLLTEAGFAEVEVIHREGATALIRARKL